MFYGGTYLTGKEADVATEIVETVITFGVQYGRREGDEKHPLGMYGDGYAVIEAPSREVARRIAHAIFDGRWSFDYPLEEFMVHPMRELFHPAGELMRIGWTQKED